MKHLYKKFIKYYCLIIFIFLGINISGCAFWEGAYKKTIGEINIYDSLDRVQSFISNKKNKTLLDKDLQFAVQQFNQNNWEIAEFYYKKTLVKLPDNPTAIKHLPWTYFYQNRYDKALKAFKRTKSQYPKNPNPLIGMGWSYFGLKNYQNAIEQFNRAEKLNGNIYEIYKGKGFTNLKLNKNNTAKEFFSKIYSNSQIKNIFKLWKKWHRKDPEVLIDMLPKIPTAISLFTLPSEYPRYQSMILRMPKEENPVVEIAWRKYRKKSYRISLERFQSIPRVDRTLDVLNGTAWSFLKSNEIEKASKIFKDILKIWPSYIGALKGIQEIEQIKVKKANPADYYFNLKKLGIAEIKYNVLQREYPDWVYPNIQLGKIKLAYEKYHEARDHFLDALELSPNEPDAKLGIKELRKLVDNDLFEADQALDSGNYKKAANIYADYIEEKKSNRSTFSKILDELKSKETPWNEYKTTPENIPIMSIYSQILKSLGLRVQKNAITRPIMPPSGSSIAHAYNGLGWSQFYKKKYLHAVNKFKIARADREYFLESSKGLGLALYEAGKYKNAANALKTVLEVTPNELNLAYKMDMSILMSWDSIEAQEYFKEALTLYPLRASLYMGLGWLNHKNGDTDLGIEYFLKAISLDPQFALTDEFKTLLEKERFGWQVYNKFGWAYYAKKDYKNSFIMFQTSMKEQPNKSEARKGIGYVMNKLGKSNQAAKYLNQVLALNPDPNPVLETVSGNDAIAPYTDTTTTRTTLANIMLELDNPYEAIALFQRELELRPNLATALDGLGRAYLKLNRLTEARTAFKAAIKYQPLNNLSHKGLKKVKLRLAINTIDNS